MESRIVATLSKRAAETLRADAIEEGRTTNDIADEAIIRRKPRPEGDAPPQAINVTNNSFHDHRVTNNTTKVGGNWFVNSFNNWFHWFNNNRFALALRAKLPNFDNIPWFAWVAIGALGAFYFVFMITAG
jgi:hypothetical protein